MHQRRWKLILGENYSYSKNLHMPIKFSNPKWQNYSLGIDTDVNLCGMMYWGIFEESDNASNLPKEIVQILNDKLKLEKLGDKCRRWSWYCYFSPPYDDWRTHIEPWLDIKSEKMAEMLIDKIVKLAEASQQIIDEAERSILLSNLPCE